LAQHQILSFKRCSRPEQSGDRPPDESAKIPHRHRTSPDSRLARQSDEVCERDRGRSSRAEANRAPHVGPALVGPATKRVTNLAGRPSARRPPVRGFEHTKQGCRPGARGPMPKQPRPPFQAGASAIFRGFGLPRFSPASTSRRIACPRLGWSGWRKRHRSSSASVGLCQRIPINVPMPVFGRPGGLFATLAPIFAPLDCNRLCIPHSLLWVVLTKTLALLFAFA
jgi:hypothetical protein